MKNKKYFLYLCPQVLILTFEFAVSFNLTNNYTGLINLSNYAANQEYLLLRDASIYHSKYGNKSIL